MPPPPLSTSLTLTRHLKALPTPHPYSAATEHPFITAAGNGTLPKSRLALWLSQDRIYASQAYPRFIGRLISSIPFDHLQRGRRDGALEEQRNQRILNLLVYSLQNVVREVGFFDDVGEKWGLQLQGWKVRKATRGYLAEMARVAVEDPLFDGMVFLWAMEQVYLDAWRHAASQLPLTASSDNPAVTSFAANWTNDEFVRFVNDLADAVDAFNVQPGSPEWSRAGEILARVVELEEAFWPEEGEEVSEMVT